MLSSMVATGHMRLFTFKLIKNKEKVKFSSSGAIATFHTSSHIGQHTIEHVQKVPSDKAALTT